MQCFQTSNNVNKTRPYSLQKNTQYLLCLFVFIFLFYFFTDELPFVRERERMIFHDSRSGHRENIQTEADKCSLKKCGPTEKNPMPPLLFVSAARPECVWVCVGSLGVTISTGGLCNRYLTPATAIKVVVAGSSLSEGAKLRDESCPGRVTRITGGSAPGNDFS